MSFEFTKIDDNVSDEEFIIECRKQDYRKLELLSEEQIDELISTQDPKERFKKTQKFVKVKLKMYNFANLNMTINFPPLLNQIFLLYDKIVL